MVTVVLAASAAGCGGDAACDLPRQEPLDPASGVHLIDASEVVWASDPPTSGPHRSIPPPGGTSDEPIPRLDQVSFLEAGGVILHHYPWLPYTELQELRRLAALKVLVAPNLVTDSKHPVVATAWGWRLRCRSADNTALVEFIARHMHPEGRDH